jgi:hypothetical protein
MKPEHFEKMRIDLNNQILLEEAISNLKQGNSHIQIHNFVGTEKPSIEKDMTSRITSLDKIEGKVLFRLSSSFRCERGNDTR